MTRKGQIVAVVLLAAVFAGGCYAYFRVTYEHSKRLRVVDPGRYHRSGQMTADGFRDAVRRHCGASRAVRAASGGSSSGAGVGASSVGRRRG